MAVTAEKLQALQEVRAKLDQRFPDATPVPRRTTDGIATGIAALDAILPNGGFPKGRLSVWTPKGGVTAILRTACATTVGRGERVAWVDGAGTIAGAFWRVGPVLVRPRGRVDALRAAEVLARSGGFALVVVTGVEPEGTENVRLSRAAHDGGTSVVALTESGSTAGLKITSRLAADEYVWARDPRGAPAMVMSVGMHVRVSALGWNRRTRLTLSVLHAVARSALDPVMPDRRGETGTYVFPEAEGAFVGGTWVDVSHECVPDDVGLTPFVPVLTSAPAVSRTSPAPIFQTTTASLHMVKRRESIRVSTDAIQACV